MTEEVYSGGTKKFVRGKSEKQEKDPELEAKIEEGYEKADIRKRKNRMIKIISILIIILILLIAGLISLIF